jgi:hypothetical protein
MSAASTGKVSREKARKAKLELLGQAAVDWWEKGYGFLHAGEHELLDAAAEYARAVVAK